MAIVAMYLERRKVLNEVLTLQIYYKKQLISIIFNNFS